LHDQFLHWFPGIFPGGDFSGGFPGKYILYAR
jgi:hypothetical protein